MMLYLHLVGSFLAYPPCCSPPPPPTPPPPRSSLSSGMATATSVFHPVLVTSPRRCSRRSPRTRRCHCDLNKHLLESIGRIGNQGRTWDCWPMLVCPLYGMSSTWLLQRFNKKNNLLKGFVENRFFPNKLKSEDPLPNSSQVKWEFLCTLGCNPSKQVFICLFSRKPPVES